MIVAPKRSMVVWRYSYKPLHDHNRRAQHRHWHVCCTNFVESIIMLHHLSP